MLMFLLVPAKIFDGQVFWRNEMEVGKYVINIYQKPTILNLENRNEVNRVRIAAVLPLGRLRLRSYLIF